MTSDQLQKYSYYVERLLLLDNPTIEPTEYIQSTSSHFPSFTSSSLSSSLTPSLMPSFTPSLLPTQSIILSTYTDLNNPNVLQYIIAISIATSILTTCCVIFTGYYCSKFRKRLRLRYLGNIASDNSSSLSSLSLSENDSNIVDMIVEKKEEVPDTVMFWFEDIYRRKMESYEGMV